MKKLFTKEVKIGIAFILALVVLYVGINFLKGINIFKPSNTYTVVFDNVTDLTLSSPVVLSGYQVGLVHSMELDTKNDNKINVDINLNKGVQIPKDSKIKLDVSLMGSATIVIEPNPYSKEYYTSSDKIPGERVLGMMESMSKEVLPQVSGLVPKLDSILVGVDVLVKNPALARSLENMSVITGELAVATKQMNQLMTTLNRDIPQLSKNMNAISGDLATVSGQFKTMDFAATYQSLDSTMKNVQQLTNKLNSNDNSLGLLLNDRGLYDSLNVTVGGAGSLMKDLRENPSKYINVKVF